MRQILKGLILSLVTLHIWCSQLFISESLGLKVNDQDVKKLVYEHNELAIQELLNLHEKKNWNT